MEPLDRSRADAAADRNARIAGARIAEPSPDTTSQFPRGARRREGPPMTETEPLRLYFACVGNSGRSQMAQAFAESMGGDAVEAASGGSRPAEAVLDHVRTAMAEVGVPMLGREPSPIDPEAVREVDVVVTMGCGEDACPSFPGVEERDWELDDPDGEPLARVREIRDEVGRRVRELLKEHDVLDEGPGWIEG